MKKFLNNLMLKVKDLMSKIKEFFLNLGSNNAGESIIIDEAQFRRRSSEKIMNENIKRYNRLLEEIEKIRKEIKNQTPNFEKAAKEFIMFINAPKEIEEDKGKKDGAKANNPYLTDFMLRRNEFEDKTRRLSEAFNKIAELRKNELNKYFEAKRLINDNSILIGEKRTYEIDTEKEK